MDIIESFRNGDEDAAREFYERYAREVLGLIRRKLHGAP
jgi:DNA-binding GntR family transcriptional regulator